MNRRVATRAGVALSVALVACGSGHKIDLATGGEPAKRAVSAVMNGDFATAQSGFTAKARQRYPVACLSEVREHLVHDYGAVQSLDAPTVTGAHTVTVVVRFTAGWIVRGKVTFDGGGKVKDLLFARPTTPSEGPPRSCAVATGPKQG